MESIGDIATVTVHIKKSVKKSPKWTPPIRSISKQSGVLDIASRSEAYPEMRGTVVKKLYTKIKIFWFAKNRRDWRFKAPGFPSRIWSVS